ILKGVDGAIEGFNSAVATVSYRPTRIRAGGFASLGVGSDSLNFQSVRFATSSQTDAGNDIGVAVSAARSEGDGAVLFGDHEFARYNLQLQHATAESQTDLFVGYQDKFYGWPGAYTGFATLPEIDDTQTMLFLANHRRDLDRGWFEVGGFHRRLEDDYDFNRTTSESGAPGSFEHETKVSALGFQGSWVAGNIDWRYGGQFTRDELVRSTDLTNGAFTKRSYTTLSVVPTIEVAQASGSTLTWRVGATWDDSNRDDSQVSPLFSVTLDNTDARGTTRYSFEYLETTQLPGYTALKSPPAGLFGGNPNLGRESARQTAASVIRDTGDWQVSVTLFHRDDDDLVDWTYATGAPFARQANPVDIEVFGIEAFYVRHWDSIDLALGYVGLDKDADYGSAVVDASFYALNFAQHRATVALTWRFADQFELRMDNEYRMQEDNPLRVGDDNAYLGSAALAWNAGEPGGLDVALTVDNLTDSEYQPFPGTPASGRQYSLSASYAW
ncbi:MAG: TonB-dependent receptor, partial [Pseudomonadota bacterium]